MAPRLPESPLSLAIREDRVNRIVRQIRASLDRGDPLDSVVIALSPKEIREVRTSFNDALRHGEHTLYRFVRALAVTWFPGRKLEIEAAVLARFRKRPKEVAFIRRRLTPEELLSASDHAMAIRIVREITEGRDTLAIAASSITWRPEGGAPEDCPVVEFVSRVKTTEDICAKIADEIFRLSQAFRHDKITNRLSRYLKDIYGTKIVCPGIEDCYRVAGEIQGRSDLAHLEMKDYIHRPKASGFMCLKLVILYRELPIEIQVLSREMRNRELLLPETSHRTYKERQDELRRRLGPEYQRCYNFLRDLFELPAEETPLRPPPSEEE